MSAEPQTLPQDAAEAMVPQRLTRLNESRAEKEFRVAQYYERTRAIDAAVYYYRLVEHDWNATTWASQARQRLIALGAIEPDFPHFDDEGEDASTPDATDSVSQIEED